MVALNPQNPPINPIQLADDRGRGIRDYAAPSMFKFNPGIVRPRLDTERFELKPVMFQMLTAAGQFGGSSLEEPHSHIKSFIDICNKFIPYSLRDAAKNKRTSH